MTVRTGFITFLFTLILFICISPIAQAGGLYKTNLLINPDGAAGNMSGWTILSNGGNGWTVNGSGDNATFGTSYAWAEREQIIDLYAKGFTADSMAKSPSIYISEHVTKTYCFDNYALRAELLDENMQVLHVWDSGIQNTEGSCQWDTEWTLVEHTFENYGPGVRYVRFVDKGKSGEYWLGHYGPRFDDATVMVRHAPAPDNLHNLLLNYDAEHGDLSDWNIIENGGNGWAVTGDDGHRRFQTSWAWGKRTQLIDLYEHGFTESYMADSPPILASENFRRVYCGGDEYYLKVELLDAQMNVVSAFDSGIQQAPGPCEWSTPEWETQKHVFINYGAGVRYVRWEDGGRDSEGWWGHYGPQIDNALLIVLGGNLLENPWATENLAGWNVIQNSGEGVKINANGGIGGTASINTSYGWFKRNQLIDLREKGFTEDELDSSPKVYASEYFGRTYCPDQYYLKVELLDDSMQLIDSWDSGIQRHKGNCEWSTEWDVLGNIFENYGSGLRFIRWEDGGRDTEFWSGHYGAKLDGAFLTVQPADHLRSNRSMRSLSADSCGGLGEKPCHHEWSKMCLIPPFGLIDSGRMCENYDYCDSGLYASSGQCVCSTGSSLPGCQPAPSASISIKELPSTIDIEGYTKLLKDITGYVATIRQVTKAAFLVPNSPTKPANCDTVANKPGWTKAQCESQKPTCPTLGILGEDNSVLNSPLFTLEDWQRQFATPNNFAELKINGNWFDIRGIPGFPHKEPCTNIFGYSVSNGSIVSQASTPDANSGDKLDAMLIVPNGNEIKIHFVENSQIQSYSNVTQAVGGFLIVKNGKIIKSDSLSSSVKPVNTGARTIIGIDKSGDTLTVMVIQAGHRKPGMTAQEAAVYMKKKHKAYHVLNLDNSGSSQLYFKNGSTTYQALKGDEHPDTRAKIYRPIPNFISIKVPHTAATPEYHDEL